MLAKVYSARGDMPGEDLLPAQEASSEFNTHVKRSTVLRQNTAAIWTITDTELIHG